MLFVLVTYFIVSGGGVSSCQTANQPGTIRIPKKYYKGKAAATVIPSVFAAYKKGDWTISGFFAITGGGGKASFDDGLPMFESAAMAGIFKESVAKYIKTGGQSPIVTPDMYTINSAMDGKQYIYSLQLGLSFLPLPVAG